MVGTLDYTTSLALPQGYKVLATPESGRVTTSAGLFVQRTAVKNGVLTVDQRFALNRVWFPPSQRLALKTLFAKAYRLDRQQVILQRAAKKQV